MKKIISIGVLSITFLSCGSVTRTISGATKSTLVKTVSIEQGCPIENVQVIESVQGFHGATYALDVCGKRMVYKQVGSVFMESTKADEMINNLKK